MSTGSTRSPSGGRVSVTTRDSFQGSSVFLYRHYAGKRSLGPVPFSGKPDTVPACSRPCPSSIQYGQASNVEEADVLGVAGDEGAAGLDVLAHQDTEQLVGRGRVVQR